MKILDLHVGHVGGEVQKNILSILLWVSAVVGELHCLVIPERLVASQEFEYKEVCIDSILSVVITYNIAKTIVSFDTKRLKFWLNGLTSVLRKLTMRNSWKGKYRLQHAAGLLFTELLRLVHYSLLQFCPQQHCRSSVTTGCSRFVSNSAAAVLSQQFAADLTTVCSRHVTTGRNMPRERIWHAACRRHSTTGWQQACCNLRELGRV